MAVAVTLGFLILLTLQELTRAHGSDRAMRTYARLDKPVILLGLCFAAIVLWRMVELAQ